MALGVGAAAVAGFGASFGRDLYKSSKRAAGTLMLLGAFLASISLPYIGARNLARGRAPGEWWKLIIDVLIIPIGFAVAVALAFIAGVLFGDEGLGVSVLLLLAASAAATLTGLLVGLIQRPSTKRRHAIAARNEMFLSRQGIRETGQSEITHVDGEGNALRLIERSKDALVFMAVGKKNRRAYIELSSDGEMLGYTGVVPLGAYRSLGRAA
ncbi:hypothetical protein ACFSX5_15915 [Devosia albogilva]|uniref:Uncharacterized protein n=1 Tax=Devosia albogilva TaxID=429726 RepID=A0ABW5QNF4_9HYPH